MRERRGWRSTTDEGEGPYSQDVSKQPVGQISVQPRSEKYFASPVGQIISTNWCRPTPQRGVSQSSRTRGADAVHAAAFCARGDRRAGFGLWAINSTWTRDVAAYGEVVWS